ncbi:uncharacterized protein MELLADRAFT_70081 [Melampsora larici-populina 98AG31]|uniref:Uncharacterized protein n=1 Tax=Melampsora larici-populina (strain 98AG31 / pathotype 3-4-7) TaxID=747676 RepID=F4SDH9_MELLP|nr:uncharacterized protein MELLADRAFT_70081 [Melampsora larici-populina 98AG31]EGF97293.1 hypothetical protein MELLADRAFT_70081 [Melampsora larici-populina 98AG31]
MRSGLERIQPAPESSEAPVESEEIDTDDSFKPSRAARRGSTQRARGGGRVGSSSRRNNKRHRSRSPSHDEDGPSVSDGEESKPNMTNYQQLGLQWGLARAEEELASLGIQKTNRPSPIGLFEAQALQSRYDLDKTMLCIVLKCSRKILDEALLEGPLAREPNLYTNFQTYSVVATTTQMPSRGTSNGFGQRNSKVGSTWSTYNQDEREVFCPRLFERLCLATSEAYSLTQTPDGIPNAVTPAAPMTAKNSTATDLEPLSQADLDKYAPIFTRLVNLTKVSRDLHQGSLAHNSMLSLLAFCPGKPFHPPLPPVGSPLEPSFAYLTCPFPERVHLEHQMGTTPAETHLLERFAFESTQGPQITYAPNLANLSLSQKPPPAKPNEEQTLHKPSMISYIFYQLAPHLRNGWLSKGDFHPKLANVVAAFEKKEFRGEVMLRIHRTSDCRVTDMMLAKGPGRLTNEEVIIWIEEIEQKKYSIIRFKKPSTALDTQDTPSNDEAQHADGQTGGHHNSPSNSSHSR